MPFAEVQSLSPRVTPEILHPASMDAANAYGVIIDGQPGPTWFNYQVQLCVTPKHSWIACWRQGGYESNPDQRVVVARSLDGGRTWSKAIVIEAADAHYRVPAWIVSYVVPRTVFLFHNVKPEGWGWYPRDPLWITVAREAPGVMENAGLDGHFVGDTVTSEALMRALAIHPVHIGFATHDVWVSIAHVRVQRLDR